MLCRRAGSGLPAAVRCAGPTLPPEGGCAMAAASACDSSGGSSDTSSTGEEERMRRLFQTCDGDRDGYISRNDLLMVCRQLNMEESVAEIMTQLGTDENGKVSFQDFTRCHQQLLLEIRKEEMDLSLKSGKSSQKKLRDRITSWPTSCDNSLESHNMAPATWRTREEVLRTKGLPTQDLHPGGPKQEKMDVPTLEEKFHLHSIWVFN